MGVSAGEFNSGSENVILGVSAGESNSGTSNVILGVNAGIVNSGAENVFLGNESGGMNVSGNTNTFVGINSGKSNIGGNNNVFLGNSAGLNNNNSDNNVCIGVSAGQYNSGTNNIILGTLAGECNSGNRSVLIGLNAGLSNSANDNVLIGDNAGKSISGFENVFIGNSCGSSANNSIRNVCIGHLCGVFNDGTDNVTIGMESGMNVTQKNNVFLGHQSGKNLIMGIDNVMIGNRTGCNVNNASSNVYVGPNAGEEGIGSENINIGVHAGRYGVTMDGALIIGHNAGKNINNCSKSIVVGYNCGINANNCSSNILFGRESGSLSINTTDNIFIGDNSGKNASNCSSNVILGKNAGFCNSGNNNILLGIGSGTQNNGDMNTFIGGLSGQNNRFSDNNVFIGESCGRSNIGGSFNTFIGREAGMNNSLTSYENMLLSVEFKENENDISGNNYKFQGDFMYYESDEIINTKVFENEFETHMMSYMSTNLCEVSNIIVPSYDSYIVSDSGSDVEVLQQKITLSLFVNFGSDFKIRFQNDDGSFISLYRLNGNRIRLFILPLNSVDNEVSQYYSVFATSNEYSEEELNKFHHVAFSYNNSMIKLYIDGEFVEQEAYYAGLLNDEGSFDYEGSSRSYFMFNSPNLKLEDIECFDLKVINYEIDDNDIMSFFMNSSFNVFNGYRSGMNNKNGNDNVFIGQSSGLNNKNGIGNVYIGGGSGANNENGNNNVVIGRTGNANNIQSDENVIIGSKAGESNKLGTKNVFVGYQAGYNNYGANNVNIGNESGYYVKGNKNVNCGHSAGKSNILGFKNVNIGFESGISSNDGLLDNLKLWYRFDSGTQVIYNSANDNNNGRLYESKRKKGLRNEFIKDDVPIGTYALKLGSTSGTPFRGNYIRTDEYFDLNNTSFSIGFWFRFDNNYSYWDLSAGTGIMTQRNENAYDSQHFRIYFGNGKLIMSFDNLNESNVKTSNVILDADSESNIVDNSWHHYMITFNNESKDVRFYKDFVLFESHVYNNVLNIEDTNYLYIGCNGNTLSESEGPFTGRNPCGGVLDDIRIYNIELSEFQCNNLYKLYSNNVFIGNENSRNFSGGFDNVSIGNDASKNLSGYCNVLVGNRSGEGSYGNNNVFVGHSTGRVNLGDNNTFIGNLSGGCNAGASNNVFVGNSSGFNNSAGSGNTFVGNSAGRSNNDASNNVFIGDNTGVSNSSGDNNTYVGKNSGLSLNKSNCIIVGTDAGNNDQSLTNYVEYIDPDNGESTQELQEISGNVILGNRAGRFLNEDLGVLSYSDFDDCVIMGTQAGEFNSGGSNVIIGLRAGMCNKGGQNVLIGRSAGQDTTSGGDKNVYIGQLCGQRAKEGSENVYIGFHAGRSNRGDNNVIIGVKAGASNDLSNNGCSNSIIIGYEAMKGGSGSNNIIIGNNLETTDNNKILIGNKNIDINVSDSEPLIEGDVLAGTLHVNGTLSANSKQFVIQHPSKKSHLLVHACLEGPENAVFYRGRSKIYDKEGIIKLPDYVKGLISEGSISVQLTAIKCFCELYVEYIDLPYISVCGKRSCEFYYEVKGTRKDISELEVEPKV